jgi:hypothetical protein
MELMENNPRRQAAAWGSSSGLFLPDDGGLSGGWDRKKEARMLQSLIDWLKGLFSPAYEERVALAEARAFYAAFQNQGALPEKIVAMASPDGVPFSAV